MFAKTPQEAIQLIDNAFQAADLPTLMSMYDDAAVQVQYMDPSNIEVIRGEEAIRALNESLLASGRFTLKQLKTYVTETDGIALLISRWSLAKEGGDPKVYTACIVLRQQADGGWKNLIDSSPAVLDC